MPSKASTLNPNIKILIDGSPLPDEAALNWISGSVSEDIEVPSMFELRFFTWDFVTEKMTWVDRDLFEIGNEVEIQLGYEDNLKTVIVGEITGLEPEFRQEDVPVLVIRGHDLRHRLLRGNQTQSFVKMKDSDIASQIAKGRGLSVKVTDSKVKLEYVLQHNQTDWEFLRTRAQRIGYEVVVDRKILYFRPHQNAQCNALTLTYPNDLQEFLPRLSTLTQVTGVEVSGWIPMEKKAFLSKTEVGKENGKMQGKKTGTQVVKQAFGKSSYRIVNQPVSSKAEADAMSLGQFQDMAIAYITAEGTCMGTPDLRAGKVINIQGVGERFSGYYYVTTAAHNFSLDQGYQTSFTARRTAT
jgi:phage protein D